MIISNLFIRHVRLPFDLSLAPPSQKVRYSDSIILEIQTQKGVIAYGESCPKTELGGETPLSVKSELERLRPTLLQANFNSLADIQAFIREDLPKPMSKASVCALEMAILNAYAQEEKKSLEELFEVKTPGRLPYSGVIPLGDLSPLTSYLIQNSFKHIKLHINQDLKLTLAYIQLLLEIYGANLQIQVDIKGRWKAHDALEQIPVLLDQGIRIFEQPFGQYQDILLGKIQKHYKGYAEFVADESIVRYKDAVRLINGESCSRFNLKISKQGGIFSTLEIYKHAIQYGISCELGISRGETSLLSQTGILLSSLAPKITHKEHPLAGFTLAQDICHKSCHPDLRGNHTVPQDVFFLDWKVDALRLDKYSSWSQFLT